jgi:hypothetical protein
MALKAYVDSKGLVDYKGLLKNRSSLDKVIQQFENLDPKAFKSWKDKDKIAFYLNVYNARSLQTILDHYPVKSIKDIPGVWDQLTFKLLGLEVTLDHVEHDILRKQFSEPRIHLALVCGSIGCPILRNKPYYGFQLDALLEEQARRFFADPTKFQIDPVTDTVYFSPLFKWYGQDFVKNYGTNKFAFNGKKGRALLNFASQHISRKDRHFLSAAKDLKIKYLDYDWSLNEQQ